MEKKYIAKMVNRPARPRSKRLQELGGGTSGTISVVQSTNGGGGNSEGHSHQNLAYLNQITTDNDGYLYLTLTQVNEDGTASTNTFKVFAGHADDADKWSGHDFTNYMDQPVRSFDHVKFTSIVTDLISSNGFRSGALGSGYKMAVDSDGNSCLEIDEVVVRKAMQVAELVIQQLRYQGGIHFYTNASIECTSVEQNQTTFKCYFDTKSGTVPNMFQVGDLARCQRFDCGNQTAKYYWRAVVEVGDDYIMLSKDDCDSGSGQPEKGDNIIQLGNPTVPARQKAMVITVMGEDVPRIEMYDGIDGYDLSGKLITVIGVVDGKVGIYTSYGEFTNVHIGPGSYGLENLSEWADKQKLIDDTTLRLTQMSSDNVISMEEKASLRNQWMQIQKEYESYQDDAETYGVSITALTNAYIDLERVLTDTVEIASDTDATLTPAQRTSFNDAFANWQSEKSRFLQAIAQKKTDDAIQESIAKTVDVTAQSQVFKYGSGYSGIPAPATITLTATPRNFTPVSYQWQYLDGSTWTNINGATNATYTVSPSDTALFASGTTVRSFRCICNEDEHLSDSFTLAKLADGGQGADGRGVVSTSIEYQIGTSGTTAPTGTWSTSVPAAQKGKYLWTRTTVTYTTGNPSVIYSVAYYATDGSNGKDGIAGKDGVGITKTVVSYAASTSNTTAPANGWQTTIPAVSAGQYLWTRTVWTYSDGTTETGYSVARQGANGTNGTNGTNGKDAYTLLLGNESHTFSGSISAALAGSTACSVMAYKGATLVAATVGTMTGLPTGMTASIAGNGTTTPIITFTVTTAMKTASGVVSIPITVDGKSFTKVFSYSISFKGDTGAKGDQGADGRGVVSTSIEYQIGTSGTTTPTGTWSTSVPAAQKGKYLWTRTTVTYTTGNPSVIYSVAYYATDGTNGKDGIAGKDGVGITKTVVSYAASTSNTTAPSSGWQTTIPAVSAGQYLWTRTVWTYSDGSTETGYSVARQGSNGTNGTNGTNGKDGRGVVSTSIEYQIGTSGTTAPTGTWSTSVPAAQKGKYLWTRTTVTYTTGNPSVIYSVAYYATDGSNGKDGIAGKDGVGITKTVVSYAASTSNTTAPASGWQTTIPAVSAGQYLWTRTVWTYSDGSTETGYSVARQGSNGTNGTNGTNGKDGRGVVSTSIEYQIGTSGTTAPTGTWSTSVPAAQKGKYLWTRTTVTYTTGNPSVIYSVAYYATDGSNGKDGIAGKDGVGITKTVVSYAASTSNTTAPANGWQTTIPAVSAGQYLWTRTVWTYSDGTTETGYSVARQGANGTNGTNGTNGKDGADGKGISSIVNHYLASASSSGVTAATSGWTTTVQTITPSKRFLWNYETINYTSGSPTNTAPMIIGVYGNTGLSGATGKGISSITEYYALSQTSQSIPTTWSTAVPTMTKDNRYLWNYEKITYTDGSSADTEKRIIGVFGVSTVSVTVQYALSTSTTSAPTSGWQTTVPVIGSGKYLWERQRIQFSDNTFNYTTAILSALNQFYDDFSYLEEIFPKSNLISEGAVIAKLIGVSNGNNVIAGINGSDIGKDTTGGHGKLLFFGGATNLNSISTAATRIYQDGSIITKRLVAEAGGKIGKFDINANDIKAIGYMGEAFESSLTLNSAGIFFTDINKADIRIGTKLLSTAYINYNIGGIFTVPRGLRDRSIGLLIDAVPSSAMSGSTEAPPSFAGDFAIAATRGMHAGLRPFLRTITANTTLTKFDHTIYINSSSNRTITLPSNAEVGQFYLLLMSNVENTSVKHTLTSSMYPIIWWSNNESKSSHTFGASGALMCMLVQYTSTTKRWIIYWLT